MWMPPAQDLRDEIFFVFVVTEFVMGRISN